MKRIKNLVFSLFLAYFFACPLAALALGQITEPIIIDRALRGGEFEEKLTIVNTEEAAVKVSLEAEGKIKDWTKFYLPGDLMTPITEADIQASANLDVIVIFNIPRETPNGQYQGFVSVKGISDEDRESTSSSVLLSQKIDREVIITVQDEESIKLEVSVIPETYDLAKGEPLSLRFIYDNQSNVNLSPEIDLKIKKDDQAVFEAVYPYPASEPAVKPSKQYEIPALEIPTSNLEKGRYLADINFLHNNQSIANKTINFSSGLGLASADNAIRETAAGGPRIYWLIPLLVLALLAYSIIVGLKKRKKKNKKE